MSKALILLRSILKIMRGFYLKRMPDSEERTFIEFCKYHQLIMNKANAIVNPEVTVKTSSIQLENDDSIFLTQIQKRVFCFFNCWIIHVDLR